MNLIICHPADNEAVWVHTQLKKIGINSTLVTVEELLMAKKWTQNINNQKDTFLIETKSGLVLTHQNLNFVLNRSQFVTSPIWSKANIAEQNYVNAEMNAMLYSWLYQVASCTKLFNIPNGYGLSGVFMVANEWARFAIQAGFEMAETPLNTTHKVLVIAEKVIGQNISKTVAQKCIQLSKLINAPILEIELNNQKEFINANTAAHLMPYGAKFINCLIQQINWKL